MTDIVIYGAGGFAREVAWLCEESGLRVCGFVDDDERNHGRVLNGWPVVGLSDARKRFPGAHMVLAVGNPGIRETLAQRARAEGFEFASVVHPGTICSRWIETGAGTIVCAANILTTNITIGQHVHINLDCTIGHDAVLGDFTTLAPGVHVSGWVHFGRRVYVGTGAVFVNGTADRPLTVGDDAVIGAGACVTKSVNPGVTVVGVPARERGAK